MEGLFNENTNNNVKIKNKSPAFNILTSKSVGRKMYVDYKSKNAHSAVKCAM